jgi:ABC-type lipoprotein release transport system permease subunit
MLGIWALVFLMSFMQGMVNGYIQNAIRFQTSHIQIHTPAFKEEPEIRFFIENGQSVAEQLRSRGDIVSLSGMIIINSMISSAKTVRGLQVKAVVKEHELDLTHFNEKITEGEFLGTTVRNPIVLSTTTAEALQVRKGSKVVLTFQDVNSELVSGAFRIVGLFDTGNRRIDESLAYTAYDDIRVLGDFEEGIYHEIAMNTPSIDSVGPVAQSLEQANPELLVETYKEISPDLELFNSQIKINLYVMTAIVMLALIFGIINTMLMAVLERIRELGMLMAIGMNKLWVFSMIMFETFFLAVIGAPLGMLVGYGSIKILEDTGIDLSLWASGLKEFGLETVIYPDVDSDVFIVLGVGIAITAVIAAIYPAIKAIRLRPVEALRKI